MRAFLRDTNSITKRYAQDPYTIVNRLGFLWLQHNTLQEQQKDIMLALVGSGKPQFILSYLTILDIVNYKPVLVDKLGTMSILNIKANAQLLYDMAMKATE